MNPTGRHVPTPTPETAHFWDGTRRGELRIQRCSECDATYFPPRPFCPGCACRNVEVVVASGRATLYSYVIAHRGVPWLEAPYVIAVVQLEEGPRMMTNIVDCDPNPASLPLDLPLAVTYRELTDDVTIPLFRPLDALAGSR